jgi:hypothetical protein
VRILFGIAIAAILFVALCAFVPDEVSKVAYQIKAYAMQGEGGKVYEWVKVELPQPSSSVSPSL